MLTPRTPEQPPRVDDQARTLLQPFTVHPPKILNPETLRGVVQRRGRVDDLLGERAIAEFGDDQILGLALLIRPDSSVALSSRFGVHDYC